MTNKAPVKIKSIGEYHRQNGFSQPEHPLISVVDYSKISMESGSYILGYYSISIKRGMTSKLHYGQQEYDFDEGVMFFMSPGQVLRVEATSIENTERSGWILLIHPDFLWNTPLATQIKHYDFFDYSVNEALFLSDKEEAIINSIVQNIKTEYHSNIDKFSQNIIISQIETMLNYAERFYNRQFITRKISNHQILEQVEKLLENYFDEEHLMNKGLPTVKYVSEQLNLSQSYLGSLLKSLTGQSTQQHIHEKLIEKAKEKLSTTSLSISEIAYSLGFEHSQSFSKLFKSKTKQSPLEFRQEYMR